MNHRERERGGVLSRNRNSLDTLLNEFGVRGVEAAVMKGIQEFASPQFRWLENCLDLAIRPNDKQRMRHLTGEAGRIIEALSFDPDDLIAEAETSMESYLEVWARAAAKVGDPLAIQLSRTARKLLESRGRWQQIMRESASMLCKSEPTGSDSVGDAEEDRKLWNQASRQVLSQFGNRIGLSDFMQYMALRGRNQSVGSGAVRLATIHSAKGLDVDKVWMVGLAENIIPSYHAIKSVSPNGIEEERRNLYVAITRTGSELTLSYPRSQNGWPRRPSRFINEMFGFSPTLR